MPDQSRPIAKVTRLTIRQRLDLAPPHRRGCLPIWIDLPEAYSKQARPLVHVSLLTLEKYMRKRYQVQRFTSVSWWVYAVVLLKVESGEIHLLCGSQGVMQQLARRVGTVVIPGGQSGG
jgi:hypothetical protein